MFNSLEGFGSPGIILTTMDPLVSSAIIGGAGQAINVGANSIIGAMTAEQSRRRNYYWNDLAAQNAMRRQIQLYNAIQSPEALLKQYEKAGLSPSLMFGGTPGQGSVAGAPHGAGPAGPQNPYMPLNMLEAAQTALTMAQTKKTEAETSNINKDTDLKELQEKLQNLELGNAQIAWNITNSTWTDPETGKATSLFELAQKHYTYESFLQEIRENKDGIDETIYKESQTEEGQKTLREIYKAASSFYRDIQVLSSEAISANFQLNITDKLSKAGFAEQNAATAIAQLRSAAAVADLTEQQKNAWNNILNRLGGKGSTTKDIIIVLGMILANFANNTSIKINTGK